MAAAGARGPPNKWRRITDFEQCLKLFGTNGVSTDSFEEEEEERAVSSRQSKDLESKFSGNIYSGNRWDWELEAKDKNSIEKLENVYFAKDAFLFEIIQAFQSHFEVGLNFPPNCSTVNLVSGRITLILSSI